MAIRKVIIYLEKRFSNQLASASWITGTSEYDAAERNLIAEIVDDASKLEVEINPNPLHLKHTPLARRYPSFPEPLHLWQVLDEEVIVMRLVMILVEVLEFVSSG